jgi:hypothetical protein
VGKCSSPFPTRIETSCRLVRSREVGSAVLQRGREDSNPRLLVLETNIQPTDCALQSQIYEQVGIVGTHMGTPRRQLGISQVRCSLIGSAGSIFDAEGS